MSAAAPDAQNACSGDPDHPRQLFNGKDLTGWKHVGPGNMTVEADGLIHTHGGMGLLYWTGGKVAKSATATSTWSTACAMKTTIPACSFASPSSPAKNGCPCTTVSRC